MVLARACFPTLLTRLQLAPLLFCAPVRLIVQDTCQNAFERRGQKRNLDIDLRTPESRNSSSWKQPRQLCRKLSKARLLRVPVLATGESQKLRRLRQLSPPRQHRALALLVHCAAEAASCSRSHAVVRLAAALSCWIFCTWLVFLIESCASRAGLSEGLERSIQTTRCSAFQVRSVLQSPVRWIRLARIQKREKFKRAKSLHILNIETHIEKVPGRCRTRLPQRSSSVHLQS